MALQYTMHTYDEQYSYHHHLLHLNIRITFPVGQKRFVTLARTRAFWYYGVGACPHGLLKMCGRDF